MTGIPRLLAETKRDAIVEDIASHPGATVQGIARRTGFSLDTIKSTTKRLRVVGVLESKPHPRHKQKLRWYYVD